MKHLPTIGLWIFTIISLAFGALEINGGYTHLQEASWPNHAKFHAITGVFCELAIVVVIVVFTWRHLRHGQAWAWWPVSFLGLVMFGGLVVANPLTHGGLSGGGEALGNPLFFTYAAWAATALWIVACVLTRPLGRSPPP